MHTHPGECRAASRRRQTDQEGNNTDSMLSWLERQLSSHQVQLAATALVSGITVAGLIYGGQAIRRKVAVEQLKSSIPPLDEEHQAQPVRQLLLIYLLDFQSCSKPL